MFNVLIAIVVGSIAKGVAAARGRHCANNGRLLEEFSAKAKAAQQFREVALELAHRKVERRTRRNEVRSLAPGRRLSR